MRAFIKKENKYVAVAKEREDFFLMIMKLHDPTSAKRSVGYNGLKRSAACENGKCHIKIRNLGCSCSRHLITKTS